MIFIESKYRYYNYIFGNDAILGFIDLSVGFWPGYLATLRLMESFVM